MSIRLLIPLLGLLILACHADAGMPSARSLHSGWQFRAVTKVDGRDLRKWRAAEVPGVIHIDLLRHGLIPDPFYKDNDSRLQWIGLTDWEYQTTFQTDTRELAREHVDLVFDGLDTFADVYLNDRRILQANNMFRGWRIPAKAILRTGQNTLRVVLTSPITKMIPFVQAQPFQLPSVSMRISTNELGVGTAPYTRKAPYQYGWDWGPRYVTQGIWKAVRLETWDSLRVESFHIRQRSISAEEARLTAELEVEAGRSGVATVAVTHRRDNSEVNDGAQTVRLQPGMNTISVPVHIASPQRWYPAGYGQQPLYRFFATVSVAKQVEAEAAVPTGLRSVELRRSEDQWGKSFTFVVNGIPVFAKGANVIPFDSFPNRVTPEAHRRILQAARDAHMNMIREWGGGVYESDDFYDLCDELGLLVWQDFMFGGDMVPGDPAFQENVRQEAIGQIKRLRDHPSLVLWCGNNEAESGWHSWPEYRAFKDSVSPEVRERVWQNYMILYHDVLKSVVAQYADPVPYWPSSPSAGLEQVPDGRQNGDAHSWSVWHALAPVETYTRDFPRFLSEYGFQSFPEMRTIRSFAEHGDLDIRSKTMQAHQKNAGGNERILTYMLREYREPKDFESFVYLSQVLQAEVIKVGAEHLRRQRPRTMGSLYWQLNDCWPAPSWSSLDYFGRWKALHYYARRFYSDLLISPYAHDDAIDVYVVSDKVDTLRGSIHARLLDFSGKVLLDRKEPVRVPGQSSAVYFKLSHADLMRTADPRQSFLAFDLEIDGTSVSRNLLFFDAARNLRLPRPAIEARVSRAGDNYVLTLRSQTLARNVYVSFGDLDVRLADNFVDLLPGEPVTVPLQSPATLDQLNLARKVVSLADAVSTAEARSATNLGAGMP